MRHIYGHNRFCDDKHISIVLSKHMVQKFKFKKMIFKILSKILTVMLTFQYTLKYYVEWNLLVQ